LKQRIMVPVRVSVWFIYFCKSYAHEFRSFKFSFPDFL
jgi:hypothetical protein